MVDNLQLVEAAVFVPDGRAQAEMDDLVSQLHARYIRIAGACVDAFLAGETDYPVESHPQAMAAHADWMAADRTSLYKSRFI